MTGDTWPGGRSNAVVLALMTGVALEMGLLVLQLIMWPDWGLGCGRAGASRALTLLKGVTWLEMICWVEMRGLGDLTLLTGVTRHGVTCWVEKQGVGANPGADCSPGTTLPEFKLLLMPVLRRGCVKGAAGVGKSISTELGNNLSPRGLTGLASIGGGVAPGRGAISCWRTPLARFLSFYR